MWVNKSLVDLSPSDAKSLKKDLLREAKKVYKLNDFSIVEYDRKTKSLMVLPHNEGHSGWQFNKLEIKSWIEIFKKMRLESVRNKKGFDFANLTSFKFGFYVKPKPPLPEINEDTIVNVVSKKKIPMPVLWEAEDNFTPPPFEGMLGEDPHSFDSYFITPNGPHLAGVTKFGLPGDLSLRPWEVFNAAYEGKNVRVRQLASFAQAIDLDMTVGQLEKIIEELDLVIEDRSQYSWGMSSIGSQVYPMKALCEEVLAYKQGQPDRRDFSATFLGKIDEIEKLFSEHLESPKSPDQLDEFLYFTPVPEQSVDNRVLTPAGVSKRDIAEMMQKISDSPGFDKAIATYGGSDYYEVGARAFAKARLKAKKKWTSFEVVDQASNFVEAHELKSIKDSHLSLYVGWEYPPSLNFFSIFKKCVDDPLEAVSLYRRYEEEWIEGSGTKDSHKLHGFFSALGYNGTLSPRDLEHEEGMAAREEGKNLARDIDSDENFKKFYIFTYAMTQACFQALGITELVLYRGVRGIEEQCPKIPCENIRIKCRALSSWTTSPSYAARFGLIVKTQIPVERIFMSPFTGHVGGEQEYVVMGGADFLCSGVYYAGDTFE